MKEKTWNTKRIKTRRKDRTKKEARCQKGMGKINKGSVVKEWKEVKEKIKPGRKNNTERQRAELNEEKCGRGRERNKSKGRNVGGEGRGEF